MNCFSLADENGDSTKGKSLRREWEAGLLWAVLAAGLCAEWAALGAVPAAGQAEASEVPGSPSETDPNTVQVTAYDAHNSRGQVTRKTTALGERITMAYSGPGSRLSRVSMPCLVGGCSADSLTVEYDYNDRGLLRRITNEAGGTKSFTYDGLERLETVKNDAGEVATSHDYHYTSGDPSTDPNYVETVQKGGSSPSVTTREITDGLGRTWQQVTEAGGGNRITQATTYDSLGRKHRSYRPFEDTDGGLFDADGDYESEPKTRTEYEASPLGRPSEVDPPGGGEVQKTYGAETISGSETSRFHGLEGTYRYVETTDESGDVKRSYKDGFGRHVAEVKDPGGVDAVTRFEYGNLSYDVSDISYDLNGNLESLKRYGKDGALVDDLGYTYAEEQMGESPNRLKQLDDAAGQVDSWDAGSGSFQYDAMGRMKESPPPQPMSSVFYGRQSLPLSMQSGEVGTSFRYSAAGQRFWKRAGGSAGTYVPRDGSAALGAFEARQSHLGPRPDSAPIRGGVFVLPRALSPVPLGQFR